MRKKRATYIQNNIRIFYRTRIICPVILIFVLVALSIVTPVKTMFMPREVPPGASLAQLYDNNEAFLRVTFDTLYFTGYTNEVMGHVRGYYYYTKWGAGYAIVLVSPSECQQGIPQMDSLTCRVKLEESPKVFDRLFPLLADDLKWSSAGIRSQMNPYLLSEPAAKNTLVWLGIIAYGAAFVFGIANFAAYLVYIISPVLSPFLHALGPYKKAKERLAEAEEELSDRPQLASEDMFITENYLIEVSESEITVLPLTGILWVYTHAPLRVLFGRLRPVRQELYIMTTDRRTVRCTALREKDIEGVIDYLSDAVPGIITGYSEQNRRAAEAKLRKGAGAGDGHRQEAQTDAAREVQG